MPKTTTSSITDTLNEPQRQAVEHTYGPLLILAGAGSGKTRALTHRIAHLMEQGVPPWQILAVTFTNKAANEMKERIANLVHIKMGSEPEPFSFDYKLQATSYKLPVMGTFHSICARILRRDIENLGRNRTFVIYDKDDQERLVKNILKEIHIDATELKPRAVLSHIGRFKCEALSAKDTKEQATTERMQKIIQCYGLYQKALGIANALDFDDLILETVRLFHEVPSVLERYQNTWKYLNVDEYQDTNHAQYLFISLLAKRHKNLCVIGDPDQSIYAFRGADIRNILEFEKEYPNALKIKLEQNYRSTQPILTAADSVIDANPNRPKKNMWTERKDGPLVTVHEVENERKEADEALRIATSLCGRGNISLNKQAIIYRTNAQSRLFEEACMRRSIPYRIVGGLKFYARKEVKDVLAYLHLILNSADTLAILRILNVPARKIGNTTLAKLQTFGSAHSIPLWETLTRVEEIDTINAPTKERIKRFTALIEEYRKRSHTEVVYELTKGFLQDIGMEYWLRDDTEEGEARWQNVQELLSVMHKYDDRDPHTSLVHFLEEVSLVSEVDKLNDLKNEAITLMTLHLCKGLEFDAITIAGCEEGIFPHSNSLFDREQLEEERRLMYVGMTRAKTHLNIFCTRNRMLWGNQQANAPSRFLDDLPDNVIEKRSDDVLSAFAWSASNASSSRTQIPNTEPDIEFNQDWED
jgi:DNA helicase II / ATP-dependent DNA helicase PcrA